MHALLLAAVLALPAAAPNPCTNGSFEELAPNGFPLHWEPVGQTVQVVHDVHSVHSGKCALRLVRTPGARERETGLNRAWKAHGGERGAMIDRLKGGLEFWYKALSAAEGTRLTVQAIPMNAEPIEGTDSPRAIFDVPKEHVGDGQWHQGRLKYDFTGDPKARWVHFGARILGREGDLLLDDFAYVEKVGPILRISRLRLDEDPKHPGERCTISALIENVGDAPAPDTRATLTAPPGLQPLPAELHVGALAPDAKARSAWTVEGRRETRGTLGLDAVSGPCHAVDSIRLAPKLELESFGPVAPAVAKGQPVRVECRVRNTGNIVMVEPEAEYVFSGHATVVRINCSCGSLAPGQAKTYGWSFTPEEDPSGLLTSVQIRPGLTDFEGEQRAEARVEIFRPGPLPLPSGRLRAVSAEEHALIENEHVRLAFRPRNTHGAPLGPGELSVRTRSGWRAVAGLPRAGRLAGRNANGESKEQEFRSWDPPEAENGETARLRFAARCGDTAPLAGQLRLTFSLRAGQRTIAADYEFVPEGPGALLALDGPLIYALGRDEAVFPGLEWVTRGETSSSALDISDAHPHQKRFVVHPNMVTIPASTIHGEGGAVGLLWDIHQKWDGQRDRPSFVFASPDRLHNQRSHLVGLFLPSVPEFLDPNARQASKPYPLKPSQPIRLQCLILADGEAKDALAAVDEWIRIYGLPEPQPLPKRPKPWDPSDSSDRSDTSHSSHGSYESEIQFSMQAYLKSLWVPETKEWWTSKGGGRIMSKKGRPHNFVADLLLGALVSPDESVRKQCRERAEEVAALLKAEPRLDAMRFPGRFDLAIANPARAAGLLATMGDDGAWRFDADQEGRGPFVGKDYHELGPDNAVEVGTCANKAFQVLRYARIAGDAEAYERMQKTLRLMETFRVPRAAQVWEVPVHTPDLLAAADAVDAYIEAYRFSGDERWLRDAVTWARRGIPFIYLWNPPDKPWLLGASIPVYGATWFTGSWFGRPVQWNGLRYATAILKLAPHDQSKDWRRLAELIVRSAILQQDPDGENVALWPDNISAIDGKKCPWVFAPRQIIQNILLLNDRDEEPQTTILTRKPFLRATRRVHISTTAKVSDAAWDGDLLTFGAAFPPGEEGCALVTNVAKPSAVALDGKPLAERAEVEKGPEPGWRYDDGLAYLCIRIAPAATPRVMLREAKHLSGGATDTTKVSPDGGADAPERFFAPPRSAQNDNRGVRVEGARHRLVDRLPTLAERLDFSFARSTEGWMAAHDISDLAVRDGALCGRATAPDPYIVRSLVRVEGDDCPVLLIRTRATAGRTAQLFWTTEASPAFGEEKSLRFPLTPDGRFHDYRLEVGKHPQWAGQTITALRLDPCDAPGEFAVEHIRGIQP